MFLQHSAQAWWLALKVGNQGSHKNSNSHIDASHSRQPLVKGERLVRYEVNAVMTVHGMALGHRVAKCATACVLRASRRTLFGGSIKP